MEGAVSTAAIYLNDLTSALCNSTGEPDLCLAAAALVSSLVPYHQIWRVAHPQCFEQLLLGMAACVRHTVKMLHLKEVCAFERFIISFLHFIIFSIDFRKRSERKNFGSK